MSLACQQQRALLKTGCGMLFEPHVSKVRNVRVHTHNGACKIEVCFFYHVQVDPTRFILDPLSSQLQELMEGE